MAMTRKRIMMADRAAACSFPLCLPTPLPHASPPFHLSATPRLQRLARSLVTLRSHAARTRLLPPLPPASLACSETTSTATTLSWEDSNDDAQPVTSYQIKCVRQGEDEEDAAWFTVNATETEGGQARLCKVVEDLEPGQSYSFQLRYRLTSTPQLPT
eukprot:1520149-Rhodomonas_salina.3